MGVEGGLGVQGVGRGGGMGGGDSDAGWRETQSWRRGEGWQTQNRTQERDWGGEAGREVVDTETQLQVVHCTKGSPT